MRGTYQVFTDKEKVELARRAAKRRITSTVRYFTKIEGAESKDQQCTISAGTLLYGWKVKYFQELANNDHVMKPQKLQSSQVKSKEDHCYY